MAAFPRVFRITCVGMAAYFLFATAVQINDPDAFTWEAIYAASAVVTLAAAWRTLPVWIPATLAAIAALWAVALAPSAFGSSFRELFRSWQMMSTGMEVGREFLGLSITAGWMAVLVVHLRRSASEGAAQSAGTIGDSGSR